MAVTAKSSGDFKSDPIPEDKYVGRCIGVYDIGTQYNPWFDKAQRKVILQWEIPEVRMQYQKDGEDVDNPRVTSREYGLTLHKKANLREALVAWRGRDFTDVELAGFDVMSVLGVPCEIQIVHKVKGENTYANVGSISKPFKGVNIPEPELEAMSFSFEDVTTVAEADEKMANVAEWIQTKIKASKEYAALLDRANARKDYRQKEVMDVAEPDDEIPF